MPITHMRGSIEEIAAHGKINASYVSGVVRLSLLAARLVEMVLDGRQPAMLQLKEFVPAN